MIDRQRLTDSFLQMVRIDSVSGKEADLRRFLASRLEAIGLSAREDGAAAIAGGNSGNLIARCEGNGVSSPVLLLGAHMDTVEPGVGIEPVVDDGIVRSKGDTILGGDDKAGIAAILEVLTVLKEQSIPHPPLEIVFTVGEEQGLQGAKALDMAELKAEFGYVLDSDGGVGEIVVQGPAQNEIEWMVKGKSAHAGMNPEHGINAIQAAAFGIAAIPSGRIDPQTTCNIGIIEGGRARNIVPKTCRVLAEARSLDPKRLAELTQRMLSSFRSAVEQYGARCDVEVKDLYPAFTIADDARVVRTAAAAARAMGIKPHLVKSGGGSDANIFNSKGVPVANLGTSMRGAHTTDEHIALDELAATAEWLLGIVVKAGEIS